MYIYIICIYVYVYIYIGPSRWSLLVMMIASAHWRIQDIVLFLGVCARINTILCAPTLCLCTQPPGHRPHYHCAI